MASLKFYNTSTNQWEVIKTDSINGVIPNNQTYTATQGQTTFTIPNGTIADPKLLQVFVNGSIRTDFIMPNNTTFQFLTNLNSGDQVYAQWFEVSVPATAGHHATHELFGNDAIDVTKLLNYAEKIQTPIGNAQTDISNLQTDVSSLQTNVTSHENNTSNPHNVTAAQVGTYTTTQADAKFVNGNGKSLSVIQVSFAIFTANTTQNLLVDVTFPIAYASTPSVSPANIVQTVSYSDTMSYPLITNVTTTGFTVKLNLDSPNYFGVGTLIMNFLVFGK